MAGGAEVGGWVWRSVGGAQIRSSKSSRMQMRQLNGVNRRASADWRHARLSSQVLRLEGRWGRGDVGGEVAGAVSIPCRAPPLSLRLHEGQLPRLATPPPSSGALCWYARVWMLIRLCCARPPRSPSAIESRCPQLFWPGTTEQFSSFHSAVGGITRNVPQAGTRSRLKWIIHF